LAKAGSGGKVELTEDELRKVSGGDKASGTAGAGGGGTVHTGWDVKGNKKV
jgi:bacteriocin-like protein